MEISFREAKLHRIFNEYALLEEGYGPDLASKIATRLAVLRAAKHLALVPERPPIRLRQHHSSPVTFTVDLPPSRKLRFAPRQSGSSSARRLDRNGIRSIEILGIE